MYGAVKLEILPFCMVYLLLIIVLIIMKKAKINQTKLLFIGSVRMTLQLIIAGSILTYIFKNPHPIFTILYIALMVGFATYRVFI